MNTFIHKIIGATALVALTSAAWAEPQSLQKEGNGTVVITSGNSATISNAVGQYGAVYTKSNLMKYEKGRPSLRPVSKAQLSFVSSGDVGGGTPRFSIPIDTNGDINIDGFAFMDVNGCGIGATLVSTSAENCKVFYNSQTFANWAAFVAANPNFNVVGIPFIISDTPGNFVISNIDVK